MASSTGGMTVCRSELICTEKALISESSAVSTLNLAMLSDCSYWDNWGNHFQFTAEHSAVKTSLGGCCLCEATFGVFQNTSFYLTNSCDLGKLVGMARRHFDPIGTLMLLVQMPKLPFFVDGSCSKTYAVFIMYYQTTAHGKTLLTLLTKY